MNDIELFAHEAVAPVVAVTGSNGKSTVVTMVARMFAAQGLNAPAGGNLSPAALDLLAVPNPDVYVLELSSFQMEAVETLHPLAAAVLNVTADHLDRHGDIERYAALKEKLLRCADLAVVNWDDPLVRRMESPKQCTIRCSVQSRLSNGYSLLERDGRQYLARDDEPLIGVAELATAGRHNQLNALAALALIEALGRDRQAAVDVLRSFRGLPHRCEVVAERRGVRYINDSKATNVGAAIAALDGLSEPIVLIAGGDSKGADLSPLAIYGKGKLKGAIVLGAAAVELERILTPVCPTRRAAEIEDAVAQASKLAVSGDTVLLSPACSSLDMFSDYRQRGEAFVAAVRGLPE